MERQSLKLHILFIVHTNFAWTAMLQPRLQVKAKQTHPTDLYQLELYMLVKLYLFIWITVVLFFFSLQFNKWLMNLLMWNSVWQTCPFIWILSDFKLVFFQGDSIFKTISLVIRCSIGLNSISILFLTEFFFFIYVY